MVKILSSLLAFIIFVSANGTTLSVSADNAPTLTAKSAILIDAQSGRVVYEKNARTRLPMASTTKIMTTLLAIEQGDLDTYFVVDSDAIKVEGSSMGLAEGDLVRLRDLCYGMMLPSGNDSANATAVRIAGSIDAFVELMNARAKEMGLLDTHFVTPSGLDDYTDEHYSTAHDMALLTREALKNQTFAEICGTKYGRTEFGNPQYERWLTNSNKLLSMYDGIIGVKTGFTDKARRCLVSACERDGVTLIGVTLNAPDDWNDHIKMYDYGFSQVKNEQLPIEHTGLRFAVVGGVKSTADATILNIPTAPLFVGELEKVRAELHVSRFVYAPVQLGDVLATIDYYLGDELIASTEYLASEDVEFDYEVEEISTMTRLWEKIKSFFG